MEGKSKATFVVNDELENNNALNEQVSNSSEDENPLPQNPDAQNDDDNDDENIIIGKVDAEGNEEILKAVLKKYPQYASEKTATITMISGITELTDYSLVTLKLDKKLPKMVASKEDEEVFEESTSRNIQVIFGTFLAAMTEHRLFARGVNFLKKDPDLLYSWAVGLTVKILILRIPDGKKWVNPFSETGKVREYEGDRIIHLIAAIKDVDAETRDIVSEDIKGFKNAKQSKSNTIE